MRGRKRLGLQGGVVGNVDEVGSCFIQLFYTTVFNSTKSEAVKFIPILYFKILYSTFFK